MDRVLAETRGFFDGVLSPLFYVQANQVNAQAPYAVAGRTSTQLQVQYQDRFTDSVTLPVAPAAPGIFARAGGTGQGAILNQDSTPNSSSNPAPRGSFVTLFATGEGRTDPAGIEGKPAEAPYPRPVLPVSLSIGGLPAEITFAGTAPGFAGLLQVNARVPAGVAPGAAIPVFLTVGGTASQPGVTLAVN